MEQQGTSSSPETESVNIPVNFKYSNNSELKYANQATVLIGEHDVVISFFQSAIMIEKIGVDQEFVERLQNSGIDAECVARIVVSKSFYPVVIDLLKRNLPRFDKEHLRGMLDQLIKDTEETEDANI